MLSLIERWGVRGSDLHTASVLAILLCINLWIRAKTIGEDERGNAERRALFVGLWPPMLWLFGDTLDRRATAGRKIRLPWLRRKGLGQFKLRR